MGLTTVGIKDVLMAERDDITIFEVDIKDVSGMDIKVPYDVIIAFMATTFS